MTDDHPVITISGTSDGHMVDAVFAQRCGTGDDAADAHALLPRDQLLDGVHEGGRAGELPVGKLAGAHATLLASLDHGTARFGGDPPRIDRIPVGAEA